MAKLSHDGLIRMDYSELAAVQLEHLYSCRDQSLLDELHCRGILASEAGFTEWISLTEPTVSIGFSWYLELGENGGMKAVPEPARANIMVVSSMGYDLVNENAAAVLSVLNGLAWQECVQGATANEISPENYNAETFH